MTQPKEDVRSARPKRTNQKGQSLLRGIDELSPGKYRGRATVDGEGFTVYGESIGEVRKALEKERTEALEGKRVKKSALTFAEQLARWLEGKVKTRAAKTADGYRYTIHHYLTPEIKALKLQAVTPQQLRTYYDGLPAHLSPATLKQIRAVVHGCLQEAYTLELIPRNPASIAHPVLERSKDDPDKQEAFKAFTPEQARRFLEVCRPDRWGLIFEFILSTGIRRGEAVGLRWPNVDLERGTVRISESVTTVANKGQRGATRP